MVLVIFINYIKGACGGSWTFLSVLAVRRGGGGGREIIKLKNFFGPNGTWVKMALARSLPFQGPEKSPMSFVMDLPASKSLPLPPYSQQVH
jgi:hypothetical protein